MSSICRMNGGYMITIPPAIIKAFGLKVGKETEIRYEWFNHGGFVALREVSPKKEADKQ